MSVESLLLYSFCSHYHCPGLGSHQFLVWATLHPNWSTGFISLIYPVILPNVNLISYFLVYNSDSTHRTKSNFLCMSIILATFSYDPVILDYYSLFTEICYTLSHLMPLVMLLLLPELSLFTLQDPEHIMSSLKPFLTLLCPTDVFSRLSANSTLLIPLL